VARPSVSSLPVPEQWVARPWAGGPAFRVFASRSGTVGAPSLRFLQGRVRAADIMCFIMPSGLHRTYGAHHLHFITCSCYRRLPFLSNARSRDTFLNILEQTRQRYRFVVVGYVVMPEHIHLLLTEPEVGTPSTVMGGWPTLCTHRSH
jgi:Transposase IS200 like